MRIASGATNALAARLGAALTSAHATPWATGRAVVRAWVDSAHVSAQEQSVERHPSLYRRHPPRTSDEMAGQEAVVRTLRNAAERDRAHHAYLSVGQHGPVQRPLARTL